MGCGSFRTENKQMRVVRFLKVGNNLAVNYVAENDFCKVNTVLENYYRLMFQDLRYKLT